MTLSQSLHGRKHFGEDLRSLYLSAVCREQIAAFIMITSANVNQCDHF